MFYRNFTSGIIILTLVVVFWIKIDNFLSAPLFFAFISIAFTTFLIIEFSLASFVYHPVGDKKFLPRVSLIIPAYNEEKVVYETVAAAAKSNYPKGLLEIITVNDGSTDRTLKELDRAQADFGIKAIHLDKNRGK